MRSSTKRTSGPSRPSPGSWRAKRRETTSGIHAPRSALQLRGARPAENGGRGRRCKVHLRRPGAPEQFPRRRAHRGGRREGRQGRRLPGEVLGSHRGDARSLAHRRRLRQREPPVQGAPGRVSRRRLRHKGHDRGHPEARGPAASSYVDVAEALVGEGLKEDRNVSESDLGTILYTSGSTGMPKGVSTSQRNVVVGAQIVSTYLENTPEDRILSALP